MWIGRSEVGERKAKVELRADRDFDVHVAPLSDDLSSCNAMGPGQSDMTNIIDASDYIL